MARLHPLQTSFVYGQLSPLMIGRPDTEAYQSGLSEAVNMICTKQGPIKSRPGFSGIGLSLGVSTGEKIKSFYVKTPLADDVLFSFRSGSVFVYNPLGSDTILALPNIMLNDDLEKLKIVHWQSAYTSTSNYVISWFFFHKDYPPVVITYVSSTDTFSMNLMSGIYSTVLPVDWSSTNGWPSNGTVHQGRMWVGGVNKFMGRMWACKVNNAEIWALGAATDIDPIDIIIDNAEKLSWAYSTARVKGLFLGFSNGEILVSSQGGVITPSDVNADWQSRFGSARINSVSIGNYIAYVSDDRKKVRYMSYDWQSEAVISYEITLLSEGIFPDLISDISWDAEREILWCLLDDGTLSAATFDNNNVSQGWHLHSIDNQEILSIVSPSSSSSGGLTALVAFSDTVITPQKLGNDKNLDNPTTLNVTAITDSVFPVIGMREGTAVQVKINDAYIGEYTVQSNQVDISPDQAVLGDVVDIGIGYVPKMVTLPFNMSTQTGSMAMWKKRFNKIIARVLDSKIPLINGELADDRSPSTLMGTVEPSITGLISVGNMSHDEDAKVTIEQPLPYGLTVLTIYGEMDSETR